MVFGIWEESREPKGNPHGAFVENMWNSARTLTQTRWDGNTTLCTTSNTNVIAECVKWIRTGILWFKIYLPYSVWAVSVWASDIPTSTFPKCSDPLYSTLWKSEWTLHLLFFFKYIFIYNRWIHLNEFTASTSELALPRPNVSLSTVKASIMNDWNERSIFQIEFCNRIAGVPVRSQMTSEGQGSGNAITGMGGLLHSCRAWEGRAVWMDPILC